MKNKISKFIALSLVQLTVISQTTPIIEPSYSYPLDTNEGIFKELNGNNLTEADDVLTSPNRYNEYGKAILFHDMNSKIVLPNLILPNLNEISYTFIRDIDMSLGYTISFWIYFPNNLVGNQLTKPTDTPFPYTTSDLTHQIFFGAMPDKSLPIGISRIRDRVVLNRMSSLTLPPKPWNLWLWDPVSFKRDTWYQLFYVIRFNRTNVYMYDMAGNKSCELNYFHAPDISGVTKWGFGSHDDATSTNFRLDDIKIYGKALTEEQTAQINAEDNINTTNKIAAVKVKDATENQTNSLMLYPNPSKDGSFTVKFKLNTNSWANLEIVNTSGQQIYKKEINNITKGIHTIPFKKSDMALPSGIYMIKVVTSEFNESRKLIVD